LNYIFVRILKIQLFKEKNKITKIIFPQFISMI
jgi:hypothetical protein